MTSSPSPRLCTCGCGTPTTAKWAPGHDSIALSTRIKSRWGDTEGFIRWFDDVQEQEEGTRDDSV